TESAWTAITQYLGPLAIGKPFDHADDVNALFAHIRGNRMAKAAIETACWDLEARLIKTPLWKLLGGTRSEVTSGVSIGLQPSNEALFAKIDRELEAGYQRIKIKIKPHRDVDLVAAVRARYPKIKLMADANSAYTLNDAEML